MAKTRWRYFLSLLSLAYLVLRQVEYQFVSHPIFLYIHSLWQDVLGYLAPTQIYDLISLLLPIDSGVSQFERTLIESICFFLIAVPVIVFLANFLVIVQRRFNFAVALLTYAAISLAAELIMLTAFAASIH